MAWRRTWYVPCDGPRGRSEACPHLAPGGEEILTPAERKVWRGESMTPVARQAWRTETQEKLGHHMMNCTDWVCQTCRQSDRLLACLDALDTCERERDHLRALVMQVREKGKRSHCQCCLDAESGDARKTIISAPCSCDAHNAALDAVEKE